MVPPLDALKVAMIRPSDARVYEIKNKKVETREEGDHTTFGSFFLSPFSFCSLETGEFIVNLFAMYGLRRARVSGRSKCNFAN